jgi:hypothetical protein
MKNYELEETVNGGSGDKRTKGQQNTKEAIITDYTSTPSDGHAVYTRRTG